MPRKTRKKKMRSLEYVNHITVKNGEGIEKIEKVQPASSYEVLVAAVTKRDIVKTIGIIMAIFVVQALVFFNLR